MDYFSESLVDLNSDALQNRGYSTHSSAAALGGAGAGAGAAGSRGVQMGQNNSANFVNATCAWRKEGSGSRTGTCLPLCIDVPQGGGSAGEVATRVIPPLQLVWKGEEALDKLHLAMRVKIPVGGFNKNESGKGGGSGTGSGGGKGKSSGVEYVEGHCAIGLEKLCKLGLCSIPPSASAAAGERDRLISTSSVSNNCSVNVKTSIAQLLVKNGTPMYHIDTNSLQVRGGLFI